MGRRLAVAVDAVYYGRFVVELDELRPVYAAGERAWCEGCERSGRRRRLGVTRVVGGGLVACARCWRAHERAGIWPSPASPHDPDECRLCSPAVTPDSHPELEAWLGEQLVDADRSTVAAMSPAQRRDALLAVRAQARREAEQWRVWEQRAIDAAGAGDAVHGAGRPVVVLAAALALEERRRPSAVGRPSLAVRTAAVMVVDAERGSGRRSRPGRANVMALVGCTAPAATKHFALWEATGWCRRTGQGGAAPLRLRLQGTSQLRAEWDLHPLPHRVVDVNARRDLVDRAVALLGWVRGRAAEMAAEADLVAAQATAGLGALNRRQDHLQTPPHAELQPCNFLSPPRSGRGECFSSGYLGLALPPSIMINRYIPHQDRPDGRADGASRRASTKMGARSRRVGRPRTLYRMCRQALDLARDLRECPELRLQLARARVDRLAATVRHLAAAGWTVTDVIAEVRAYVARRIAQFGYYTPPTPPDRPLTWLKHALASADPTDRPTERAAAAAGAALEVRRREQAAMRQRAEQLAPATPGRAALAHQIAAQSARRAAESLRAAADREMAARQADLDAQAAAAARAASLKARIQAQIADQADAVRAAQLATATEASLP